MDLNSSLDDIIGSRTKHTSRRRPPPSNPSYSSRFSSSRPTSRGGSRHDYSQRHSTSRPDLRSRINSNRVADRHHGMEKTDLRGRIGKHGNSNGGGLTTANLPNRQKYQRPRASSYDNNNDSDGDRQDSHGLIIRKSVNQRGLSTASITSSSSLGRKGGSSAEVDPGSIVITKRIENTRDTTPSPPNDTRTPTRKEYQQHQQQQQDIQQQQLLQQIQEAERLKQYLQQQEQQQQEQQLRQEMDRALQHQLQSQRELIMDLQRQLEQRKSQQSLQQQQYLGGSSSFSFRSIVNNDGLPPYNQSTPNIVLLSNLDPIATAEDVKAACGAFGPVTRCELIKDTHGRSAGEAEVEYLDRQSALDCIAKFDNEYIDGRLIRAILRQQPSQHMRSVIAPTRSGYRTTSQVLYTSKRP